MPGALGPSAEQAWSDLRQHTEWVEGFWLAWLFTGYEWLVHEYEERMLALLSERGAFQIVLRPRTPEEVRTLLEEIFTEKTRAASCVWVEILIADVQGDRPGPWTEAWDWLMMRANERRGALSGHLSGGLIFAGAPPFKGRTAAAAPDLWSIRSLMLEPAPPAAADFFNALLASMKSEASHYTPDVELALAQAERMHAQGHRAAEAAMLERAAWGFWVRRNDAEVIKQASKAMEAAGDDNDDVRFRAQVLLVMAEIARGNPAAAATHVSQLLDSSTYLHEHPEVMDSLRGVFEFAAGQCRAAGHTAEAWALEEKLAALSRTNEPSSDE